jgi:hypothetical protein
MGLVSHIALPHGCSDAGSLTLVIAPAPTSVPSPHGTAFPFRLPVEHIYAQWKLKPVLLFPTVFTFTPLK